jgi:hypothetical protein
MGPIDIFSTSPPPLCSYAVGGDVRRQARPSAAHSRLENGIRQISSVADPARRRWLAKDSVQCEVSTAASSEGVGCWRRASDGDSQAA